MLSEEKKNEIKEFLMANRRAKLRDVATQFGATYAQVYAIDIAHRIRTVKRKKPAVKAKSNMGMKKPAPVLAPAPTPVPVVDMVNQPPHYTKGGIETIDFIDAKELNYNLGNVVKYVARSGFKGARIEDLKKAKWYLEREINFLLGS
jgi:hypothetical protein